MDPIIFPDTPSWIAEIGIMILTPFRYPPTQPTLTRSNPTHLLERFIQGVHQVGFPWAGYARQSICHREALGDGSLFGRHGDAVFCVSERILWPTPTPTATLVRQEATSGSGVKNNFTFIII